MNAYLLRKQSLLAVLFGPSCLFIGFSIVKSLLSVQSSTKLCSAMQVSVDGLLCCTISNDQSVKIYDVVNYDMMVMIRLPFVPGSVEWVYKQGDVKARLAISDRNSSFVHIYDARAGSNESVISREVTSNFNS